MKTCKRNSAAYNLCLHVWQKSQQATSFAYIRINQSMHEAVMLAITSGMKFGLTDFNRFFESFRAGYWIGCTHEMFYKAAVETGNMSACHAYEYWQERKPFIIDDKRVFVGHTFQWNDQKVRCSSIKQDHIIACAYKLVQDKNKHWTEKLVKRYRITRADVSSAKKAAKQVAAAATAPQELAA
jgi:hypothetical protein